MTDVETCPGCGAPNVVVGLDCVLIQTRPTVRRHACNVGRVTLLEDPGDRRDRR